MPVVRKGAGRPAAAAKKRKHAQRTPLPPKQEPQEEAQPAKNGKRQPAKWIAPRADAKTKAEDFTQYARDNGWWAGDVEVDGAMVRVVCKRVNDNDDKEAIYVEWDNGRIRPGAVQYELVGVRRVTLRNVSAARQVIDGTQTVKRDVQRRPRKAGPRTALRFGEDGSIERVEVNPDDKKEIIGAHIIDKWYDIVIWREAKVGRKVEKKVLLRSVGLFKWTCDRLIEIWTEDYPDAKHAVKENEGSIKSRQAREAKAAEKEKEKMEDA